MLRRIIFWRDASLCFLQDGLLKNQRQLNGEGGMNSSSYRYCDLAGFAAARLVAKLLRNFVEP
jgi:hypothetical protein